MLCFSSKKNYVEIVWFAGERQLYACGSKLWKQKGEHRETVNEWVEILKLLEGELGDKKFFGDDAFGYVDIALVPFIVIFYAFEQCAKLSMEEECPKIVAWAKRCMEREGVSKALSDPKMIYEMILSLQILCNLVFFYF